jgi:hypothetical protein
VRNGLPIPVPDASGRWHKKKKVASVSLDIKLAVQRQGYYQRKPADFKEALVREAHVLVWTASHPHGSVALSASY